MLPEHWIDISDRRGGRRRVHVRISGSGKPLLLLHGYPLDSRMWLPLIARLSTHFLCVAPDLRGFGESPEERFGYGLEDLAADTHALLEVVAPNTRPILCGLSMGGYVAMRYMSAFGESVDRVVLTNTRANADDPTAQKVRREIAANALKQGSEQTVAPMLGKLLSQRTMESNPSLVDSMKRMMFSSKPSSIAWAQLAMANRPDSLSELANWNCPALCIGGASDPLTPPEALQAIADRISGASICIDPNSAHMTPLESPDWFAKQLLDWADLMRNETSR